MIPEQWQFSAFQSWGVRLNMLNHKDVRADLLRGCQIKGDCWVSHVPKAAIGAKRIRAQEAAYGLFVGPIPRAKRMKVVSNCSDLSCCNPEHLYLVHVKRAKKTDVPE